MSKIFFIVIDDLSSADHSFIYIDAESLIDEIVPLDTAMPIKKLTNDFEVDHEVARLSLSLDENKLRKKYDNQGITNQDKNIELVIDSNFIFSVIFGNEQFLDLVGQLNLELISKVFLIRTSYSFILFIIKKLNFLNCSN